MRRVTFLALAFVLALPLVLVMLLVVPAEPASARFQQVHASGGVVGGDPVVVVWGGGGEVLGGFGSGGGGGSWSCGYHPLSWGGGSVVPSVELGRVTPVAGEGYVLECVDARGSVVYSEVLRFDPGEPLGSLFAGRRAAEVALGVLVIGDPVVGLSPPGAQLVGLETWLWVQGWGVVEASASVSGVSATVRAAPVGVRWVMGDGAVVECGGPGRVWVVGVVGGTDCSHTYTVVSAGEVGGVYGLVATVVYEVSWVASNGESGDLGRVQRSSTVPVQVVQAQALIR